MYPKHYIFLPPLQTDFLPDNLMFLRCVGSSLASRTIGSSAVLAGRLLSSGSASMESGVIALTGFMLMSIAETFLLTFSNSDEDLEIFALQRGSISTAWYGRAGVHSGRPGWTPVLLIVKGPTEGSQAPIGVAETNPRSS